MDGCKFDDIVIEQFCGTGRNVPVVRKYAKDDHIFISDSSQGMIEGAIKDYGVKRCQTFTQRVQDFDWEKFKDKCCLIFQWWGFCYLSKDEIENYIKAAKIALKDGSYMIVAEPISLTDNNV